MAQARLQGENPHNKKGFFSADNSFLWLFPGFGLLLVYAIFPLIYNIYVSFQEWDLMNRRFSSVGGENWQVVWYTFFVVPFMNLTGGDTAAFLSENLGFNQAQSVERLGSSALITLQYVAVALVLQIILGMVIALLLDAGPWGAGLMQSVMILPMVIAPAIAGMIFRLLLHSEFGGIQWLLYQINITSPEEPLLGGTGDNALAALLVVDVWQWTPFFIIIILAGLKGLPQEVLEASSVDGANFFQRLFRIKLPLLRGVLLIAVLFRLIDLYRVYDYVHIMTSGGPANKTETLSYYAGSQLGLLQWGWLGTLSVVILIIAWLTAYLYQRIFRIEW
ncbi:MAG: sugar ABC transporter permease [Chloroflexota bacterium]